MDDHRQAHAGQAPLEVSLAGSLEALVAEHDRIGSPLRAELRPGPAHGRVEEAVRSLGLEPPPELIDFFAWRDLAARPGGSARIDWFWPAGGLRLPEAVDDYRRSIELGGLSPDEIGDTLGRDQPPWATFTGVWRTDWFSVLSGSPETYAIECPGGGGSIPGAVWRVNWHPDSDFQTARVANS